MADEDEQKKGGAGKGFAGLSSLISDVDTVSPPSVPKKKPAAAPSDGLSTLHLVQPESSQRQAYKEPVRPPSGVSGGMWMLGIAAVLGVFWLIGQSNKTTTTSSVPADSPTVQNTAPANSPPAQLQAQAPAKQQAPSRPTESKPPIGQNLLFSREQIRYCLAEVIRMAGAKSALNKFIESDVDRFNGMVADYNSRCGSFRYRSGAMESSRRDIESYRSQLHDEGRLRLAHSPSTASQAAQSIASVKQGALSVQFTGDCWAQVTDANGRVLYSGLKRNGENLELVGLEPLEVRLGYALGAKVKYNGVAVDITPFVSGETARIRFGG